ncbi:MAG: aminotransferase class IV [Planctomycetota bacterium]|jgi:branched-subunit amino acid aminotransferase/4-amino-4-deoxychorismate lyase
MDEPQAYLNGRFIPASTASISLADAGFVLGATVAERVRTFAGEPFHLGDHLDRLEGSLETTGIDPGVSRPELEGITRELVARNHRLLAPGDDLDVAIFVTPGLISAGAATEPTVCVHTSPLAFQLWAQKYQSGQSLVTTDVEQVSPKTWPPNLKCRSRMHYYLADRRAAAIEPGARALLLDAEGFVTEASTANVMVYRATRGLIGPPHGKVLSGISEAATVELARGLGIGWRQQDLAPADVASADEVFLTSTPFCLVPVTRLNGRPIADGSVGEVFGRLMAAWSKAVGLDVVAQAERFAGRGQTSCPRRP